jgi:hypothetical protein
MPLSPFFRRALRRTLLALSIGAFAVTVPLVQLVFFSEAYCAVLPGIDTRYASDFTEAGFDQIRAGMDSAQVCALVGEPYGKLTLRSFGDTCPTMWSYTGDGKCGWLGMDFAWLGREVCFDESGKVSVRRRHIYYD